MEVWEREWIEGKKSSPYVFLAISPVNSTTTLESARSSLRSCTVQAFLQ